MRKNSLLSGLTLMLAEGSLEIPALISAYILELPEMAEKYVKIAQDSAEKFKKIADEYEKFQGDQDYDDWRQYFQEVSNDLLREAGDTEHLVSMFGRISQIAKELGRCATAGEAPAESGEGEAPAEEAPAEGDAAEAPAEEAPAEGEAAEAPAEGEATTENSAGVSEGAVCFGNSFNKIQETKKDPEKLKMVMEECQKISDLFKKCSESEGDWATYYGDWYRISCDPSWRHNQLKYELIRDHHSAMSEYFGELATKINPEAAPTGIWTRPATY